MCSACTCTVALVCTLTCSCTPSKHTSGALHVFAALTRTCIVRIYVVAIRGLGKPVVLGDAQKS